MKSTRSGWLLIVVLLLVCMVVGCGAPAGAQLKVESVWARPAMAAKETGQASEGGMGMMGTGAIFMTLTNEGRESDRLIGGKTDAAQVVEIHETVMEGDVMKMQMLADGLEIPARDQVELKPGGYHVMLIGMQRDLEVGDEFAIELHFEKSGTIIVNPIVRQP